VLFEGAPVVAVGSTDAGGSGVSAGGVAVSEAGAGSDAGEGVGVGERRTRVMVWLGPPVTKSLASGEAKACQSKVIALSAAWSI
jgi:hypothetical protein